MEGGSSPSDSAGSLAGEAARITELEAAILTDRRILMAGGLQCPCPGCGPEDEGQFDPWAPAPARSAVGAFGVQQQKQPGQSAGDSHAEALNGKVAERLELNQLELAELRQKLSAPPAAGSEPKQRAGVLRGSNQPTEQPGGGAA